MVFTSLNALIDWNPQFFREVKGRLTRRNTILAIAASFGLQGLIVLGFASMLPDTRSRTSQYCTGAFEYYQPTCVFDDLGYPIINWTDWCLDIFQVLSWLLIFAGLLSGVYLLMTDLGQEEQRGTLNFIRLSPQPSQRILWGKLLGVPILAYLAIALALPLHLITGLGAHLSAGLMLALYIGVFSLWGLAFTSALLFVSLGVRQAWVGALAVCFGGLFLSVAWRDLHYTSSYLPIQQWYGFDIGNSLFRSTAWWVISLSAATYWLWIAVNRHFRNPNALLISKRQSYIVTLLFELWLIGMMIHEVEDGFDPLEYVASFAFVNLVWFTVLAAALMPSRQALLDWARYRRVQNSAQERSPQLLRDLLWNDKSPTGLALGIHLAIALVGIAVWLVVWPNATRDDRGIVLGAIALSAVFLLTCTLIAQLIVFSQAKSKLVLATLTVTGLVFVPPLVFLIGSAYPDAVPLLWLCSAFGLAAVPSASIANIGFASLIQLSALLAFSTQIAIQLRKASESEFKALTAAGDPRTKTIGGE